MRRVLAIAFFSLASSAGAQLSAPALPEVDWEQRLGAAVPREARFVDANGDAIVLGDLLGERPIVLALVYYECPMLCNMVLNGMLSSLGVLRFDVGDEYDVIALGIDPDESFRLAREKKDGYVARYDRDVERDGWHFLTGNDDAIRSVADAVGFRYTYVPETDEYAHAAGICILTPEGELSRVFYGTEYSPRDIEFGLIDATDGGIGSLVDKLILRCFHYDPTKGKYGFAIMSTIRFFGTLTVALIALSIFRMLRRGSAQRGEEVPAT